MSKPVLAYTIPYSTYRLLMCLRCAKHFPDGPDKQPVTDPAQLFLKHCDKCNVKIPSVRVL